MEIKTRKAAALAGENTFFTGKICKNGHLSYRYVQSGTCYECINGDRVAENSPTAIKRNERLQKMSDDMQEKFSAKSEMVSVNIRCYNEDRAQLAAAGWALAMMRWPQVTQGDVDPGHVAKDRTGGTGLCTFNCHPDDVTALWNLANDSLKAHSIGNARERIFGVAVASVPLPPVPDFAYIVKPGDPDYKG